MTEADTASGKKRVLLVAPLPPPVGGDTVSAKRLFESRYWEQAGFEIECIDTSPGEGVRTTDVKRTVKDPFRAMRIMSRLLVRLPNADIMLLWANSSFIVSLGIPVMRLARTMRRPYIVKPFGTMLADRIDLLGPARRKEVVSGLRKAEYLLPQTSRHAEELVTRSGLDPGHIVQFPNFLPDGSIIDPIPEKRFSGRCVFLGQIKAEKGVFDILDALRGRNDLSCDFYGQILARDKERFFSAAGSLVNCSYRGTLEAGEVIDTLGQYDVLLLPTSHPSEGHPAAILEAFAAGIPVIATEWRSIPELIGESERGILIPPSSPERVTSALDRLKDDGELYLSLTRNAHEYVAGFSERKAVGEILISLISAALRRE
jgi:glycosyltransferase involved in cell wall biosynthesis